MNDNGNGNRRGGRRNAQAGRTLAEIAVGLVVFGILTGLGMNMISGFGKRGAVKGEAEAVADALWDLRSKATTGMRNPCLDFPDNTRFRAYSDANDPPDGYTQGDKMLDTHALGAGVRFLRMDGGKGPLHSVCFESQGILGSANAPLLLVLGKDDKLTFKVSLLPATGMARVE